MTGVASIPDRTQLTALYSYLHPMGYGEIFGKKIIRQNKWCSVPILNSVCPPENRRAANLCAALSGITWDLEGLEWSSLTRQSGGGGGLTDSRLGQGKEREVGP